MKRDLTLLVALMCCMAPSAARAAQGSSFSFQGQLSERGHPANGSHDFQFALFAEQRGGMPATSTVVSPAVRVTNGLFSVLLDFGGSALTGQDRWLDIAVRPTGSELFTSLSPRQPVTAVPSAMTALTARHAPGVAPHTLHAAGSRVPAVFLDEAGHVGIGTTNPASVFHATSRSEEIAPPRLESWNASQFNAGWDFYHRGVGMGYVGVPDTAAPIAPGEVLLFGGAGIPVSLWSGGARALTVDPSGNVGIATAAPANGLDVRGDLRLGSTGGFQATADDEGLRIVRGAFGPEGEVIMGAGFTVARIDPYRYVIRFSTPFSNEPVLTATTTLLEATQSAVMMVGERTRTTVHLQSLSRTALDRVVHFIAVGPR